MSRKFYEDDDGTVVLSVNGCWVPGIYESVSTAEYAANHYNNAQLQGIQNTMPAVQGYLRDCSDLTFYGGVFE